MQWECFLVGTGSVIQSKAVETASRAAGWHMAHLRAQNGKDIGQGLLEKRGPAAWPAHSTKPKQPPLCPDLTERRRGHTKPGSTRCVNFISKRCSSDTEVAALTAPLGRISQLSTATRDTTAPLQELRPYIWTHIRSKLLQVKHTCPHTDCHNYFWNNDQTCGLSSLDQQYNSVHSLYISSLIYISYSVAHSLEIQRGDSIIILDYIV